MEMNLFGEFRMTPGDYAKKIVRAGYAKPFYKVHTYLEQKGVSCIIRSETDGDWLDPGPGLYAIYRRTEQGLECLYVGHSHNNCSIRIYRFMKELANKSHPLESHSGAKKARWAGVKIGDDILVKVLYYSEMKELFQKDYFDANGLDENIAVLLDARFNERRRCCY